MLEMKESTKIKTRPYIAIRAGSGDLFFDLEHPEIGRNHELPPFS